MNNEPIPTLFEQAKEYLRSGQVEKARSILAKIIRLDPRHELAWLHLAECMGETEQKRFCLQQVLQINSANLPAAQALAELAVSEKTADRPDAAVSKAVAAQLEELLTKGAHAAAESRHTAAYEAFSQVLTLDSSNIPALLGKGLAAGMLSTENNLRCNEAVRCFTNALEISMIGTEKDDLPGGLQKEIANHCLTIADHLNRMGEYKNISGENRLQVEKAALQMLVKAYTLLDKDDYRQRVLSAVHQQIQIVLESEQRLWQIREIDLQTRPDLLDQISGRLLAMLPSELQNDVGVSGLLAQFTHKSIEFFSESPEGTSKTPFTTQVAARITRYLMFRFVTLALTLVVGVYIAVVIANLGGYVDQITRAQIGESLNAMFRYPPLSQTPVDQKGAIYEEMFAQMEEAAGLNQPFLLRCARWTVSALRFEWAHEEIFAALPYTLTLFGVSALLLFISSLLISVFLALRYGSWLDRLFVALSPISSAPSWVHGIILLIIFAVTLRWLPYGGLYDAEVPETRLGYAWMLIRHSILPVLAIFLSMFFQLVYTWRTFFLIQSGDDYVEVARAKGLPSRVIEQRYVLKPTLSFIITNFTLAILGFWQTSIALEVFFGWPGIGSMYMSAVSMNSYRPGLVVSLMTLFAYLMAVTFFLLDIFYVFADPRVDVANLSQVSAPLRPRFSLRDWWKDRFSARPKALGRSMPQMQMVNRERVSLAERFKSALNSAWFMLKQLAQYPTAIVGLVIIVILLTISMGVVISIPYDRVVSYWVRDEFLDQPKLAMPAWTNLFRKYKLPETITLNSLDGTAVKTVNMLDKDLKQVVITYRFDYPYDDFPQDIALMIDAKFAEKRPFFSLTWVTPDQQEREIASFSTTSAYTYLVSMDDKLQRKLKTKDVEKALFINPAISPEHAVRGQYELRLSAMLFEKDADVDAKFVLYGQVFGLAGTDVRRRDLLTALLWGAPAALGIGFVGAVLTTLFSMIVAALGVWFGGFVDWFIQRISEINIILPMIPIGIMVYYLYSKNIWVIVSVIIFFTVFGSPLKSFRSAFIQVKQSNYIEAAQAYGVGDWRLIINYMVPRIIPVLIPQLVATIPGFVFLEATLAILGVYDLYLPTWGKIIYDALAHGAFTGYYFWVMEPLGLLLITGVAFALLGFALDRIFNPRLRVL